MLQQDACQLNHCPYRNCRLAQSAWETWSLSVAGNMMVAELRDLSLPKMLSDTIWRGKGGELGLLTWLETALRR